LFRLPVSSSVSLLGRVEAVLIQLTHLSSPQPCGWGLVGVSTDHDIVFISHWTNYVKRQVRAVYNHLSDRFGRPSVFLNTRRSIWPTSYPSVIWEHPRKARVLLGVIGPQWLTIQNLDSLDFKGPDDWGHWEIAEAIDNAALLRKEGPRAATSLSTSTLVDQH
jgi:hypothetical protein